MTHNYTPELLIKYVYGEADIADRLELEYGLENNAPLRAQYLDILNSYRNVPKVAFSPKTVSYTHLTLPTICSV